MQQGRHFLKGQGAAEYLILLAIVLVVALVGILLLGGFTATGGDARDAQSVQYWSGVATPFAITQWTQIGNTLYMTMANRANDRYILRQIVMGNVTVDLGAGWSVGPQSVKNISISGLQACNQTTYDSFSYNVSFYYDSESISNHSQIGVKPLAGKCSF